MRLLFREGVTELRSGKSRFGLRIGNIAFPIKRQEFFFAATANDLGELRIGMTCKILELGNLSIFLAHKQDRNKGREKRYPGRKLQSFEANQMAQPFAEGAIPHLIAVLITNHKVRSLQTGGGIAVPTPAVLRKMPAELAPVIRC